MGANGTETVAIDELESGDRVMVRVGDAFPADGLLLDGVTRVNEALLTGESLAVPKRVGDGVIAGSINVGQPVTMEITASGEDSTVSALGRLLQRARSIRCRSTDIAERFAGYFVVGVLLIAVITFVAWYAVDRSQVFGITLSVLVVSCPCAFSLASPAVFAAASRALLRQGIILTRGNALETLATINRVIFDKTGTLTAGQPAIDELLVNPERPELESNQLFRIAASLERYSAHPLSRIFNEVAGLYAVNEVTVEQGGGVTGRIDGQEYWIGSKAYVMQHTRQGSELPDHGFVMADRHGWLASFRINDPLKPGAAFLSRRLKEAGIGLTVLSGDSESAVESVAGQLGITDWHARQSPQMKLARLAERSGPGSKALMVGDGVNDAPVLAAADVSMAVHGGAELANAAADFILTGSSLELVWKTREVAIVARRIIRQNIAWAISYNLTMIPLAVSGMLKPWMAALGMSASSLLVVLNAARTGRRSRRSDRQAMKEMTEPLQT
jgi:Cu2+-exporting ATPase